MRRDRHHPAAAFADFVHRFCALADAQTDEGRLHEQGTQLLRELVSRDDWLAPEDAQADPRRYRQNLLHLDPARRFSVVAFVWGPGQQTPIHDHTVWGLIGMLRGAETSQGYRFRSATRLAPDGPPIRLLPGQVEAVGPRIGDVHRVRNAFDDRVSISIHVYGGDIGRIERTVYSEDGARKPFISGYSPPWAKSLPSRPASLMSPSDFPSITAQQVRSELLARREIALLDVREEDEFAREHPLWAANLSLNRIELDAWGRIPRRDAPIVLYGGADGGEALRAAGRLHGLGYTDIRILERGLEGWRAAGGELFIDVNVPSKAFGEWLEAKCHTPSLAAEEVKALLDDGADVVVLDARRFDEYQVMSIPTAVSVPGAELVLRVRDLAPDPATRVIVNCAGRTRSLIGAQSLVNAGIPNPVAALRNGTIGWKLARQALDHGAARRPGAVGEASLEAARRDARTVADRAGVVHIDASMLAHWHAEASRTTYLFDVRTPEEYATGHLALFRSAPGGQLVQETDVHAPVRGARIVLVDHDGTPAGSALAGVRAEMTASWLAQMGWEVAVLAAGQGDGQSLATGPDAPPRPAPPTHPAVAPHVLADWLAGGPDEVQVIDVTTSANYVKKHVPGAWFALRSRLAEALARIPRSRRVVLTCATSTLAWWVVDELRALLDDDRAANVFVLEGGTNAWLAAALPFESGEQRLASPRIDRYRRPYEGVDVPDSAMQAYLDWEFGLVAQLERDGTHFFEPI